MWTEINSKLYAAVKVSIHIKLNQSGYEHNITVQLVDTYFQKGDPKKMSNGFRHRGPTVNGNPVNWTKNTTLVLSIY